MRIKNVHYYYYYYYSPIHDVYDERGTAAIFITKNRTPEKARSFPRIKIVDRRI